jgi:hypothetical protein
LKYVADHAQGKVVFMDSGAGAATRIAQHILSMGAELPASSPPAAGGPR